MAFVMNLCDYLYVLDFGVLIAQGVPRESGPIRPCSTPISDGPHDVDRSRSRSFATAPSRRCAASTSTSPRARSSR